MNDTRRHGFPTGLSLLALALFVLSGCGASTINIEGSYPSPLVAKLPLTVGVYYDDSFRNFSYIEIDDASGKDELIINSGASQVKLFNTVLPAVFAEVVELPSLDAPPPQPVDLVFVPEIQVFQVGLPHKTRLDLYEIWIKYNMRLTEGDGDFVADWAMTAYGKSPTETFKSTEEGVNNATIVALRDLAASFTLGLTAVPEVNEWLRAQSLLSE